MLERRTLLADAACEDIGSVWTAAESPVTSLIFDLRFVPDIRLTVYALAAQSVRHDGRQIIRVKTMGGKTADASRCSTVRLRIHPDEPVVYGPRSAIG